MSATLDVLYEEFDSIDKVWKRLRYLVFFPNGEKCAILKCKDIQVVGTPDSDWLPHLTVIRSIDDGEYQDLLRKHFNDMLKTGRGFVTRTKQDLKSESDCRIMSWSVGGAKEDKEEDILIKF